MNQTKKKGMIYVILAAIIWAVTGVLGQIISEEGQPPMDWVIDIRLIASGMILLLMDYIKNRRPVFAGFREKADGIRIIVFSVFGCGAVQITYFYAIAASNAATASFLQYTSPALIIIILSMIGHKLPNRMEIICTVLAVTGTFLIATHGSFDSLSISVPALVIGLSSALAFAFYTIYPAKIIHKYGTAYVLGWGFLIGGLGYAVYVKPWEMTQALSLRSMAIMLFLIVFGSVIAFRIYSEGVELIGGARANMISTLEPLTAALLSFLTLGTSFAASDYVGFGCIISITFILAKMK